MIGSSWIGSLESEAGCRRNEGYEVGGGRPEAAAVGEEPRAPDSVLDPGRTASDRRPVAFPDLPVIERVSGIC